MASTSATLGGILDAAARGSFPPPDGTVTVVPQPSHRDAGVVAFTAHSVVFTDEDPQWVRSMLASLDCDALATAMNPRFHSAFLDRTGRTTDTIDLLTVAAALPGAPDPRLELREIDDPDHPGWRGPASAATTCACGRPQAAAFWSSAVASRGAGRRRSRSRRAYVTGDSAAPLRVPPGISYRTATWCGRSSRRATRAACGLSKRRGTGRWGRRRCSSRGEVSRRFGPRFSR